MNSQTFTIYGAIISFSTAIEGAKPPIPCHYQRDDSRRHYAVGFDCTDEDAAALEHYGVRRGHRSQKFSSKSSSRIVLSITAGTEKDYLKLTNAMNIANTRGIKPDRLLEGCTVDLIVTAIDNTKNSFYKDHMPPATLGLNKIKLLPDQVDRIMQRALEE